MVAVTSSICSRIEPVVRVTSSAARADSSASWRTSSATTAKPRPCSPARAASIAAFNASRLVCDEMRLMSSTKSSIDTLSSPSWLTWFEVVCTPSRTLTSTLPGAVPHLLDGVRQHAELAGHLPGGDRSQIAGAEPLGGRHQAAQRPVYRLDRVARQEEARDHESDDEDPELALPIGCVRAQPLRDLRRLLRLPLGEITHQPRQLRRLGPHRRRSRSRFLIASQVPERVCDRVLSLDGRVELLHAVHGEAILDSEAAEPIQPALVLEGLFGGGLKIGRASCRERV